VFVERTTRVLVVLVITVVVGGSRAFGYRPFVSTDAAVADLGEVEIELGYAGFRAERSRVTIIAPTMVSNLGIAQDLELVGEFKLANDLSHDRDEDATRVEDGAVSLKWVLRDGVLQDDGSGPSVGVELSALLPTRRGESRPGGELTGLLSARTLGWTYHLNAGALVEPDGSEPGLVWGMIGEHAIYGTLRAVAEINGESVRTSRADNSFLVGTILSLTAPAPLHVLSLDVGVRRGLSSAAADWAGTAGVTFAFPWLGSRTSEGTR
jgi:hypothetical protein